MVIGSTTYLILSALTAMVIYTMGRDEDDPTIGDNFAFSLMMGMLWPVLVTVTLLAILIYATYVFTNKFLN